MRLSERIARHWVFYKGRPRRLRPLVAKLEAEIGRLDKAFDWSAVKIAEARAENKALRDGISAIYMKLHGEELRTTGAKLNALLAGGG